MSRTFRISSLCLAIFACVLMLTPFSFAQDFSGTVKAVAGVGATPVIHEKVDYTKLASHPHSMPQAIVGSKDLGRTAPDMKLTMQLELRRPKEQQHALELLEQKTMDPNDKMFGKTLSPTEFAETFGMAASDLATIKDFLASSGFAISSVDNARMAITFEGTVAQAEAAFHTEIHDYMGADGVQHFGNNSDAKIPAAFLQAVGHVVGLDNFSVYRPRNFDGPVTDFAAGTTGEETPTSGAPKVAPTPSLLGELLHDASFTASKYSMPRGGSAQLNIRLGGNTSAPTGSLLLSDEHGNAIAYIADVNSCESYNSGMGRSCNVTYRGDAIGIHDLTARYSGDSKHAGVQMNIRANVTGPFTTTTGATNTPVEYYTTAGAGATVGATIIANVAWISNTTAPTGTIAMTESVGPSLFGTATLPVSPATTSTGSCTATNGTCSYSCTTSVANQVTACTFTLSAMSVSLNYVLENELIATYSGDANYNGSAGYTYVYAAYGTTPVNTATITSPTATTAATYGAPQSETVSVTVTTNSGTSYPFYGDEVEAFVQAESTNQFGTQGFFSPTTQCPSASDTCTFNITYTVPSDMTPGSYSIVYQYSGATYYVTGNRLVRAGPAASTGTALTVNKQTPTFSNMTFSPASVIQGESQAVVISNVLNYTGVGAPPTGAVTYVLNTVSYTAACTAGSGTTENCSATVPAATIAALAANSYAVTAAYTTDTNYAAVAAATGGTFVVGNISTGVTASPNTEVYGSGSTANTGASVTLTDNITVLTAGAVPTGTVTFTNSAGVTAIGSAINLTSCPTTVSGSYTIYGCSLTWTPPAGVSGDNAGTYTVTGAFASSNTANYANQSATATFVISKNGTSTTATANPTLVNGTTPSTVVTSVTAYSVPGNGLSPTGTVTLTCGAASPGPCTNLPAALTVGGTSCPINTTAKTFTCTFPSYSLGTNVEFIGSYPLTATYSGDVNYTTSNGAATVVVSNNDTTTTAITAAPTSVTYGQGTSVTYTVTVSNPTYVTVPTGSVSVSGTPITSSPVVVQLSTCTHSNGTSALGTDTCTVPIVVPAGTAVAAYTVTAAYSGDGSYGTSTGTATESVTKQTPTFSGMTFSPASVIQGQAQAVVISNVLNYTGGGSAPTGAVTYVLNAVSYPATCTAGAGDTKNCSATVPSATIAALATGNYPVTAAYTTDTNYAAIAAATGGTFVVGSISTGVTVSPGTEVYGSGSTANTGAAVTLTDNISVLTTGPVPTGTVTFSNSSGVTAIGSAINLTTCPTTVSGSNTIYACSLSWTPPAGVSGDNAGSYTITGAFASSNTANYPSLNATGSFSISQNSTITTVSASPTTVTSGSQTTVLTTVTTWASPGNGVVPTGTVAITCGAGSAGTCTSLPAAMNLTSCTANASARTTTCTFTAYNLYADSSKNGTYNMTATYSGDTNYSGSNGATPVVVSRNTPTTTTITANPTSVAGGAGATITYTIVVTNQSFTNDPSGTVTISGTPITGSPVSVPLSGCTGSVAGNGTETCSKQIVVPVATPSGMYTVTAAYSGDSNYQASSGTVSVTVTKLTPTLVMATPTAGAPVTQSAGALSAFSVTSTLSWTGATAPTASDVVFTSTAGGTFGVTSCGGTSPATCTSTFTPTGTDAAGNYNFSVSFTGDTNYNSTAASTITGDYVINAAANLTFTSVSHNFGQVAVGTAATAFGISVKNSNTVAYPFNLVFTPANGFTSANNCGSSLAAGASCEIVFYFTPTATGPVSATWSLTPETGFFYGPSNGGTLSGSGTSNGGVSLTTNGHNFGTVAVGTTSSTYGTELSNSTATAETISLGTVSAPFHMVTNCGTTLAAGASCEIEFTYMPTTTSPVSVVVPLSGSPTAITSGGAALPNGGITLSGN